MGTIRSLVILVLIALLCSCKEAKPVLPTLDLLSQGLPLKIKAPEDVVVASSDLGIMKDVTVKNEEGFSIQIFESEATTLIIKDITQKIKADIEASLFFSKMVKEEDGGFIFEKKIDENYITYDFRRVQVVGDKQYVIQAGLSTQHSLENVEVMYASVD